MPHAEVAKVAEVRENEIATEVIRAALKVHTALGPGLLESVYEVILAHDLRKNGLSVERQRPIRIRYDGLTFDEGFRADLVLENLVIVELKSVQTLVPVHSKQLLTQLRLADLKLGLLINFGEERLKHGNKRVANGLCAPDEDITL
jgi:GxxExxY protein